MKSVLVIALFTLSISLSGCSTPVDNKSNQIPVTSSDTNTQSESPQTVFYGSWTITGPLAYGKSFELGDKEIEQLLGKKIDYEETWSGLMEIH